MAKYKVDVYDKIGDIFVDEGTGVSFGFPDYTQASAFAEQMVVQHEKTVIISADTEKRDGREKNVC